MTVIFINKLNVSHLLLLFSKQVSRISEWMLYIPKTTRLTKAVRQLANEFDLYHDLLAWLQLPNPQQPALRLLNIYSVLAKLPTFIVYCWGLLQWWIQNPSSNPHQVASCELD